MKRQLTLSEFLTKANKLAADLIRHDKTFATRRLTRSQALSTAFLRIRAMYDVVTRLDVSEILWRERERQENERPEFERVQEFYSHPVWNAGAYVGD